MTVSSDLEKLPVPQHIVFISFLKPECQFRTWEICNHSQMPAVPWHAASCCPCHRNSQRAWGHHGSGEDLKKLFGLAVELLLYVSDRTNYIYHTLCHTGPLRLMAFPGVGSLRSENHEINAGFQFPRKPCKLPCDIAPHLPFSITVSPLFVYKDACWDQN